MRGVLWGAGPPDPHRTSGIAAGLALALAALLLGLRAALGLDVPLGSDAALWGLAALGLQRGDLPAISPLYPALSALGGALSGAEPWRAGAILSALALAAAPAALLLLLRGAGRWALLAPAGLLALPRLWVMGAQVQPDALTALLLLAVLAAALAWERDRTPRSELLLLGAALLLALTREHGLVVLPVALAALAARRGFPIWLIFLAIFAGAALLALGWDHLPARLQRPLQSSPLGVGRAPLPDYLAHHPDARTMPLRQAWLHGERLRFPLLLAAELARRHAQAIPLLAAGAAGLLLARRPAGLIALSPALPLLFFWSHERHSVVILPAALAGVALGMASGRRARLALPPLLALAAALSLAEARDVWANLQGAAAHARQRQALAAWLAQQPGDWLLAGLDNEINLHLGWPRHAPHMPQGCARATGDGADWSAVWVAPAALVPPPLVLLRQEGELGAFRLEPPAGEPRPCQGVALEDAPLYLDTPRAAAATPACEAPVDPQALRGWPPCPAPR